MSASTLRWRGSVRRVGLILATAAALVAPASGRPVPKEQAQQAAAGWLARSPAPLGAAVAAVGATTVAAEESGAVLFYAVNLVPAGYVIVAADDEVEPIVAIGHAGMFANRANSPLWELLRADLADRMTRVRERNGATARAASSSPAKEKWDRLLGRAGAGGSAETVTPRAVAGIADVRVAPMVRSVWSQSYLEVGQSAIALYNYYTPWGWPGDPSNYDAGCVTTAWAQIMRFHQWPVAGVGTARFPIGIDGYGFEDRLLGGNEAGGPYLWANMVLEPNPSITDAQARAIGALMHDVGVANEMHYTYLGSSAYLHIEAMKSVFDYASVMAIYDPTPAELHLALRTNLDAGLPLYLSLRRPGSGHAVVADGYGYNLGTLYHHLNLGWGDASFNVWYNLPTIDTSYHTYAIIDSCVFNVDPTVAGLIVSGRIATADGRPVAGATVSTGGADPRSATTDAQGIYAIKGLAAGTRYTVTPQAVGCTFTPASAVVTTGELEALASAVGNRVADFAAQPQPAAVIGPRFAEAGGSLLLAAATEAGDAIRWRRNGAELTGSTIATLALNNLLPADTGLYDVTLQNAARTMTGAPVIVGVSTARKVIGHGTEVGSNILVPSNGNTFDQVLLEGADATITADHVEKQITRISFLDLDDDIVQVEFSGPGTLSLVLDGASGPALPVNYQQNVAYVKGHAGIVIVGATEQSNVSVFSVGRATAVNQSLFRDTVRYDGIADIAFVAIASANGKFGGVRTANAHYFARQGYTGLYAPGVQFCGPVYLGDVSAFETAKPVLLLGSAQADTRIAGGDLAQDNGQPVEVGGLTRLAFTGGTDSHGNPLPAQSNRAVLRQDGRDVTAALVANP